MTKGQRSERQIKNSSRWTIYIIDSVNETKLSCYTPPPTQQHRFFRSLPLFLFHSNPITTCLQSYLPCPNTFSTFLCPLRIKLVYLRWLSEYSLVSCFSSHLILLSSDSPIGTPYQSISEEDPRTESVPLIPNDLQTPTVMNM